MGTIIGKVGKVDLNECMIWQGLMFMFSASLLPAVWHYIFVSASSGTHIGLAESSTASWDVQYASIPMPGDYPMECVPGVGNVKLPVTLGQALQLPLLTSYLENPRNKRQRTSLSQGFCIIGTMSFPVPFQRPLTKTTKGLNGLCYGNVYHVPIPNMQY
jgi:hypothetical protein